MQTEIIVEQCDRFAASTFASSELDAQKVLRGELDGHLVVQAFARHRLAERERCNSERDLPHLTEAMMHAAMTAHYGKDCGNIDGLDLTVDNTNYSFRQGFRRMWSGIRAELRNRHG